MQKNVQIISDGTAHGTKVLTVDGAVIPGITAIDISIRPGEAVKATIEMVGIYMAAFGAAQIVGVQFSANTQHETPTQSFDDWMRERVDRAHQDLLRTYEDLSALDRRMAIHAFVLKAVQKAVRGLIAGEVKGLPSALTTNRPDAENLGRALIFGAIQNPLS